MRWKWWEWVLCIVLGLSLGPYVLGGLYAWLAVPVYSQVCLGQPFAFMGQRLVQENYTLFLGNHGCTLAEALAQSDRRASDPKAFEKYLGLHQFWGDDVISNLFANLAHFFVQGFIVGAIFSANLLVRLINEHVLLKGVFGFVYAGIIAFLGYFLSHLTRDIYEGLKRLLGHQKPTG